MAPPNKDVRESSRGTAADPYARERRTTARRRQPKQLPKTGIPFLSAVVLPDGRGEQLVKRLAALGALAIVVLGRGAHATTVAELCGDPVPDPCRITTPRSIDPGSVIDLSPGSLVVATSSGRLDAGPGTMTLVARDVTLDAGSPLGGGGGPRDGPRARPHLGERVGPDRRVGDRRRRPDRARRRGRHPDRRAAARRRGRQPGVRGGRPR